SEGRTLLIPFAHIVYIAAEDDYSFVHTTSQQYLSASRLKDLENRLARYRFFRIHRKYLVNLDMVTEVNAMPGSNLMLRTAGSPRIELPVSRRRIQDLKTVLGL
ncbi:MAG: LytTR family DNA-binding domain-containing protein, partial [Desulfohalobium sp.]